MMMDPSGYSARGRTYLSGIALMAALSLAAASSASAGQHITTARILQIALRQSRADHEQHPRGIVLAAGPLGRALAVMSPTATNPPPPSDPRVACPHGRTGAERQVDLVAAHGHFTSNGSKPRGAPTPKGRVLELLIDACSGAVEAQAILPRVPVPLSRLGPVRALD
jgi:F0F1-type ATP synthase membrane subunit c/vacuolar-type H+-ATPase subunit K